MFGRQHLFFSTTSSSMQHSGRSNQAIDNFPESAECSHPLMKDCYPLFTIWAWVLVVCNTHESQQNSPPDWVQRGHQGKTTASHLCLFYLFCFEWKGCPSDTDLKSRYSLSPKRGSYNPIWTKSLCSLWADCIRSLKDKIQAEELTSERAARTPSSRHAALHLRSGFCQSHCWVALN